MTFTNEKCNLAAGHHSWGVFTFYSVIKLAHHTWRHCSVWVLWLWRLPESCWSGEQWPHWTNTSPRCRLLSPLKTNSIYIILFLFLGVLNTNDSMAKTTCIFILDRKEARGGRSSWATSHPPTLPLDRPPVSQSLKNLFLSLKLGRYRDCRQPKQDFTHGIYVWSSYCFRGNILL